MLTRDGCAERLRRLADKMPRRLSGLILADPKNIHRLVNFHPTTATLGNDTLHLLLVRPGGDTVLVVDNWQRAAAEASFADRVEVCPWYDMRHTPADRRAAVALRMVDVLAGEKLYLEPLGVEAAALPHLVASRLAEPEDVGALVTAERECKDADEVACIERALRVIEAAHATARQRACDGLSEIELVGLMAEACTRAAGESIQLLGDFASGERTIAGGGPATERVMRAGELLILDIFPIVGGYRADITATLCVGGEPTDRQCELFDLLKAAQEAGEAALRPGAAAGDVYRAVQQVIADAGHAEHFGHHAGHGVGAGHPEAPFFVPESVEPIRAGQVVTLEPGVYLPDWGGLRIEHNYRITSAGPERLSRHHLGL